MLLERSACITPYGLEVVLSLGSALILDNLITGWLGKVQDFHCITWLLGRLMFVFGRLPMRKIKDVPLQLLWLESKLENSKGH